MKPGGCAHLESACSKRERRVVLHAELGHELRARDSCVSKKAEHSRLGHALFLRHRASTRPCRRQTNKPCTKHVLRAAA